MVEVTERLSLPPGTVAICDHGCGTWFCVEAVSEQIVGTDASGCFKNTLRFRQWIELWATDQPYAERLFETIGEERVVLNPFKPGETLKMPARSKLRGVQVQGPQEEDENRSGAL